MNTQILVTAIVSILASGGVAGAIAAWLKDRKKDDATALLTNVEALQKQVVLLTTVTDYLRRENGQLQLDLVTEQEGKRQLRVQLAQVEEELQQVRRTARQTQQQCDDLSERLRRLVVGEGGNGYSDAR